MLCLLTLKLIKVQGDGSVGKSVFVCDPRAHLPLYTRVHSLVCTRNQADGNTADEAVERIASSFHCKVCSCVAAGIPERVSIPYNPPLVVRSTHRRELLLSPHQYSKGIDL